MGTAVCYVMFIAAYTLEVDIFSVLAAGALDCTLLWRNYLLQVYIQHPQFMQTFLQYIHISPCLQEAYT